MLDFNKDETEQKTMTAHVILSFDNVIERVWNSRNLRCSTSQSKIQARRQCTTCC